MQIFAKTIHFCTKHLIQPKGRRTQEPKSRFFHKLDYTHSIFAFVTFDYYTFPNQITIKASWEVTFTSFFRQTRDQIKLKVYFFGNWNSTIFLFQSNGYNPTNNSFPSVTFCSQIYKSNKFIYWNILPNFSTVRKKRNLNL